ncbi:LOW QUALITY PROTEIN: tigger transposable element-derived protein 4-like [Cimex lectularius]|uniref:HTH psq-type domain-containing protein n=1 Tax=Cimex lectularius TaxID=79782 RepID=A0A8I6RBA8_CIMLE|nr:LOW QUALITY PROTEIN: tigger transposable element-derived protein 4-like [Cimex lectularius]
MASNKRRAFSIEEKVKIIQRIEKGETIKSLVSELNISQSTISTIWKSKEKIKEIFEKDVKSKKKLRNSQHEELEAALLECHLASKRMSSPGSWVKIFNAPMSWITRFRARHNIVFGKISGESSSVPAGVSENWLQCIWPTTRENFADEDIYNADETGLFYRLTPDKTLLFKGESCHGGKHSKETVTVLVASNMTGTDKKKLLIIGKSPRCFKNVQKLPLDYTHNKKAWMTSEIFSDWLRKWDEELQKKKRKILLTVDNCSSHLSLPNLKNIELNFLPPNRHLCFSPWTKA